MWKNIYRVSRQPSNAWWNDMRTLNRHKDHLFGGTRGPIRHAYPLIEAWSGESGLIVIASMPGIDGDDVDITVEGRTLSLSGSRPEETLPENARAHRQERANGRFSRSIELPYNVDVEGVTAAYENGILRIELPCVAEDKPRKITLNNS